MKKIVGAIAIALIGCLLFSGCGNTGGGANSQAGDASDLVVGFVYVGSASDQGWTNMHDQARIELEQQLGVKTIYKESVSDENADVEKAMRDMINGQNAKVIFATSYGYMNYVEKISKEFPDVKFYHCSGYKSGSNLISYFGRMYQARYLAGILAGKASETGKIGYVAAMPIPEVIRGINAFTQGVRSVNPDATVSVRWTNTWYDPAVEKTAAESLIAQEGVDLLAQHQDSPATQTAAKEHGVYVIGYDCDTPETAVGSYLTAAIWDWSAYYINQVKSVIEGSYKSENYWGSMSDGIVALAPFTDLVTAEMKSAVDDAEERIVGGTWDVFTGPIKDQNGVVKVPEGNTMTDEELMNFNWFVEGVVGSIPSN